MVSCFTMLYHDGCAIVSAGNGNLDIDQKNWRIGSQHGRCGVTMVAILTNSIQPWRLQRWSSIQHIVLKCA